MIREMIVDAIWISCVFTAIPLGCAAIIGLFVSILQAVTQVQEQTTAYVAKLVGVSLGTLIMLDMIRERFLGLMLKFGVLLKAGGDVLVW